MGLVTLPNTIQSGDTDDPSRDMANWTTIRDEFNGNIENINIKSSAAIVQSKLSFDSWSAWTPTYSANNSMTWTSVTTNIARYFVLGKVTYFQVYATGTTGGTPDAYLQFTLPSTPSNNTSGHASGGCSVTDGLGLIRGGIWYIIGSGATTNVGRYDLANFGAGTDRSILVQGFYESA